MINPFDYLFYKIYVFLSHLSGGGNPITHLGAMGVLLGINVLTIYLFVYGESPPFIIYIILTPLLFYAFPKKMERIISKYDQESEKSRLIGNTAVTFYVLLSIASFILVVKSYAN